jgi:hypothetical protein
MPVFGQLKKKRQGKAAPPPAPSPAPVAAKAARAPAKAAAAAPAPVEAVEIDEFVGPPMPEAAPATLAALKAVYGPDISPADAEVFEFFNQNPSLSPLRQINPTGSSAELDALRQAYARIHQVADVTPNAISLPQRQEAAARVIQAYKDQGLGISEVPDSYFPPQLVEALKSVTGGAPIPWEKVLRQIPQASTWEAILRGDLLPGKSAPLTALTRRQIPGTEDWGISGEPEVNVSGYHGGMADPISGIPEGEWPRTSQHIDEELSQDRYPSYGRSAPPRNDPKDPLSWKPTLDAAADASSDDTWLRRRKALEAERDILREYEDIRNKAAGVY